MLWVCSVFTKNNSQDKYLFLPEKTYEVHKVSTWVCSKPITFENADRGGSNWTEFLSEYVEKDANSEKRIWRKIAKRE